MKAHTWTALIGAVMLGAGALSMPAQAAGAASAASAASAPAAGYGPGYGPRPGYRGGWGMGPGYGAGGRGGPRGGPAGPGAWGADGYAQGYGPCAGGRGGWDGGPGTMGGWGGWGGGRGGWEIGPGMMGGWGGGRGGWGMGPGMMGGWGGWGGGHHAAWADLDLSQTQMHKLEAIARAQSDKQWALMTKLHRLMWSAPQQAATDKAGIDAVMKTARQVSDLRLQMMRNRLEARAQVDAVLTPQQRQRLQQERAYRRGGR